MWSHTMKVLEIITPKNEITVWAAICHDLGKGSLCHEAVSESIVRQRLPEYGVSPEVVDKVARVVRTHMADLRGFTTDQALRNFIAAIGGPENLPNWIALRRADVAAYGNNPRSHRLISEFEQKLARCVSAEGGVLLPGDSACSRIVIEGKNGEQTNLG